MPGSSLGAVMSQLKSEWQHPSQALSVLTLAGPDVIRCALAQLAGTRLTPVAFSFGWVAYSFSNLVSTVNGGSLMPAPEISCLVINTGSGYARSNRNWLIAKILHDFQYWSPREVSENVERIVNVAQEADRAQGKRGPRQKAGLCISVFSCSRPAGSPVHDVVYYSGFFVTLVQLAISIIPFAISGDWVPFLVTFSGIVFTFATGAMAQWKEEKWGGPLAEKRVVITRGNGAQHAIIVESTKNGMDFEALAALEPTTSLATRVANITLAVLWIAHLITLVEMARDAWYFMAVGGIGMIHNVFVAGVQRRPPALGIHLNYVECIADAKVMKALEAVEMKYPGVGASLLPTFFPGKLRPSEEEFWRKQENLRRQAAALKKVAETSPPDNVTRPEPKQVPPTAPKEGDSIQR